MSNVGKSPDLDNCLDLQILDFKIFELTQEILLLMWPMVGSYPEKPRINKLHEKVRFSAPWPPTELTQVAVH